MISFKLNLPLGSDAKNDQPKKSQRKLNNKMKAVKIIENRMQMKLKHKKLT